MTWTDRARCAELEREGKLTLDDFFPENNKDHAATLRAKAACGECPVRAACLDHAIEHNIDYGIWGGVGAKKRQAMKVGLRSVA